MKSNKLLVIGAVAIAAVSGCTSEKIVTAKGEYVQVQKDSREVIQHAADHSAAQMREESSSFLEKHEFTSIKLTYSATEIDTRILQANTADRQLTTEDQEAARRLVQADYEKYIAEVVCPAWAKFITDDVGKRVRELVAAGKFEEAREVAWNAPMTDCEEVNAIVRRYCIELLRTEVNPVQWPRIEKELRDLSAKYENDENELEKGRDAVSARAPERAYSRKIDEQLSNVVAEAAKLGADRQQMESVAERTHELLDVAANLVDALDEEKTNVTTEVVSGAVTPQLEAYERELAKYREDLLKFDCTKKNAEATVKAVDAVIRPQLLALARDAVSKSTSSTTLRLGITALNDRLSKLQAELVAEFNRRIEARELRKLLAKIEDLRKRVSKLVADGKYAEARELAWTAAAEDGRMRTAVVEMVAVIVNPVHWTAVEAEFLQKTNAFVKAAKFDEAIAWLKAYPAIKTYAREIDLRLDDVGKRAKELGVPDAKVADVVGEMQVLASGVERLVDNTDSFKSDPQKAPFSEKDLEPVLKAYREALVRNDCTVENADLIVKETYARLCEAFFAAHPELDNGYLVLGSNAFNARLAKLVRECVDAMVAFKCRHIIDELVRKVTAAVKAKKFAEARKAIRSVPLMGDADCDMKIYAVRVGLLNSVVNPAQVEPLLAEIEQKENTLLKADKCQELLDWVENYSFVRDLYEELEQSFETVKRAAVGLEIADGVANGYVEQLADRLRMLLDKRDGSWLPENTDFTALGKALEKFDKAIAAQYFDTTMNGLFARKVDEEVRGLWKDHYSPLTTWELNEKLRARLLAVKDAVLKHKAFCDSQIAMAEAAIAEQLSEKIPEGARLQFNAVLGDYARAMRLRKFGGELNADMLKAMTLGAVYLGSKIVLECALSRGADANCVSTRDPLLRTPLLLALQLGRADFVSRLLAAGANVKVVDVVGNGAVHYAVDRGDLDLVWQMMARGCDVNLKNKNGETPLFTAVRKDQQAIVSILTTSHDPVRSVALADVKNAVGATPFDVACQVGSREVLEPLLAAGAKFGVSQLVIAVTNRRLAVVRWLVNRGVDVNSPGVMEAARDCSDVKTYLVSQGGIPLACQASCCRPAEPEKGGRKSAEAAGTLTFKVSEEE